MSRQQNYDQPVILQNERNSMFYAITTTGSKVQFMKTMLA